MKELFSAIVLMFILTGGSIAYLGAGENRSLGFTNVCGDRGTFCFRSVVEKRPVAPEVAAGAKHYSQCASCHGMNGEGGMGPKLAGQTSGMIVDKLTAYKNGKTIGNMSNVMWGQAGWMTSKDMKDIGDYVETL
jgi:cytochrome c553